MEAVVCLAEVTEVAGTGDVLGDEEEELVRDAEERHLGCSRGLGGSCAGRPGEVGVSVGDWDRTQRSAYNITRLGTSCIP